MQAADLFRRGFGGSAERPPHARAEGQGRSPHAGYRPDIDGLRAVAVIPVMLFHAGFSAFSGGYVGVDVFFVISGYLITTIILRERLNATFSLRGFYERRARRIAPALILVVLACAPFALLWMLPNELVDFGRSVIAVCTFVSNVLFWRSSGYFDGAAELKPLLHTWSLGIEEQYYLFFPLVVGWLFRIGLRRLFWLIGIAAATSFAISVWLGGYNESANFYLLPSRAWELFAGSLLACWTAAGFKLPTGARLRATLSGLGMLMIALPIFLYDESTPFPGVAALPVIVGTVLVLGCTDVGAPVGRFLTLKPVLGIGLISYSAYLWHQPLFAFARLASPGAPPAWLYLGLSCVALALAYLSWKYVEAPFRDRRRFSRAQIFGMSALGSALLIGAGAAAVLTHGFPSRFKPDVLPLLAPDKTLVESCPEIRPGVHACRLGDPSATPSIALLGDSHAYAIASELGRSLTTARKAGVLLYTDCHPIPGLFDSREPRDPEHVARCARANAEVGRLATAPSIEGVIVAIRWTMRLYPLNDLISAPAFDNGEGGVELDAPYRTNLTLAPDGAVTDAAAPKAEAVRQFLAGLAARKKTVVVYPTPEVGWLPARLNLQAVARGEAPPETISTSSARYRSRNAAALQILDSIGAANLRRSRPQSLFCDTILPGRCVVQADDVLYYYDDDHVSTAGAKLIVADVLAQLAR